MRRQDAVFAQLAFGVLRVGERVQAVGVDHERTLGAKGEVDHQPPGRAVATQSRTDDPHLRGRELAEDRVVGRVPDRPRRDLRHGRRHDLRALGGEDWVDGVGDQQADEPGAGPGRGG